MINNKLRYLIAGCGVSGQAAARLLSSLGFSYGIIDQKNNPELRNFIRTLPHPPEQIILGWQESMSLPPVQTVILSPGIRRESAFFQALSHTADEMLSEPEFALQYVHCPTIAITGTNGKTTTTELTLFLLKACGISAESAGNIGVGLCDAAWNVLQNKTELLVIEISSFQLEYMNSFKPTAAAILNLASDHLDRHGSMKQYAAIKFSLVQDPETFPVFGRSLDFWRSRFVPAERQAYLFSSDPEDHRADFCLDSQGRILFQGQKIIDFNTLKLKGRHNAENVMAALALIAAVKGKDFLMKPALQQALTEFQADAHRMELFLEEKGIRYINDSKATNPHSVIAALNVFPEPGRIILLMGGLDKDMMFEEILPHLKPVKQIFLYGACQDKIFRVLSEHVSCTLCSSFDDAVKKACSSACSGDIVMLSPATASMDLFKNYRERGDRFKLLVQEFVRFPISAG